MYAGAWSLIGGLTWTTAAVYFLRDVGMTPFELVVTGTALEVAYFLCEVPTGVVADLYSRRLSLVVSAVVIGTAMLATGLFPFAWAVIAAAALWGFGWTFRSGAEDAWLADETGPEQLAGIYQRSAQVGRASGLVGIAAAVVLASVSLRLPFVVGALLCLLLAGYLVVRMPEHGFTRPSRPEGQRALAAAVSTARSGIRVVRGSPLLLLVLVISVVLGAWSEAFDRLWEAHLMLDVGLDGLLGLDEVAWFGVLAAGTLVLSFAVAAPLVGRLERLSLVGTARLLMVLHLVLGVAALVFALAGSLVAAVAAYWSTALVRDLISAPYSTWLNGSIRDSSVRATVLSVTGVAGSLGEWTGGPVLGAVGTRWSVRVALVSAAVLLAPVVGLFARATRSQGRLDQPP